MSSRRIPLAHVPNAANSPFRAVAAAASKRSRSHSSVQRELPYGQPPPAKKQMIDRDETSLRTPPQRPPIQESEGRVFTRRTAGAQPTAFERRLVAARDRQAQQQKAARQEKSVIENLEHIRQWQKHYRKVFPHFVFYFESIPEDVRKKLAKQIAGLGAREEKFFSKAVTHIVTTRPLPSENDVTTSIETISPSSTSMGAQPTNQPRTINPSLLDRSAKTLLTQDSFPPKSKFTFEAPVAKQPQANDCPSGETRKQHTGSVDILSRAKEMGMKIWALEKLQRMMTTMFDTDTTLQQHGLHTRSNSVVTAGANRADLSQLLHNERLNGPSDRDSTVAARELVMFKGPYIYIHDMDEKTRAIMVRDYPKVSHREDGAWPQFRSSGNGRCPFVEDVLHTQRDLDREQAREKQIMARFEKKSHATPRTRAAATVEATKIQPSKQESQHRPLSETQGNTKRVGKPEEAATGEPFAIPKQVPAKRGSPEKTVRALPNAFSRQRLYNGLEPNASGVQPSNITSAIRSQMISSTAAAPGAKAGTSKEVHELKRKVLEKNSGPTMNSIPHSSRMIDLAGAADTARSMPVARAAKRKAQEKLGYIHEDFTPSEEEDNARTLENSRRAIASRRKKLEKNETKPGYCENCQEKFDDFDYHTDSRKHRKFALNNNNWTELDDLLQDLVRPLREE
ncbi:MAG: hypothetical protein M1830_004615 [Pleopsidium flavum]|nr:MAG: hypothetical protein M1830_004615 [Pleopsidium flavum]